MAITNNGDFPIPEAMLSYLSADGETVYYWYKSRPAFTAMRRFQNLWLSDAFSQEPRNTENAWKSRDRFGSVCRNSDSRYEYATGYGMLADRTPPPPNPPPPPTLPPYSTVRVLKMARQLLDQ